MPLPAAELTRLSRLLDEALPLDEAGRAAWLENLPPEDADLRALLAELLADDAAPLSRAAVAPGPGPISLLDRLPAMAATAARQALGQPANERNSRVGPYGLLRRIGEGGMGEVWLAERVDGGLQREVALKLPARPAGSDPQRLARRFERERDILAALEHPHIARLYDAGIAPDGQPYLAMEYVDGQPLTAWSEQQALPLRARIELFLQVLQAVQHAHSQLVVHRDLKPSNIFVNREGQVRLLDFGIATLLADEAEPGHGPATEWANAPMTPNYASPEQIAGEPLGTASDVYSLGVVLCELLSGQRPYRLARASRGALEDAILHTEPSRPSQLVGAEQPLLRRELRGDLDTIALKALRKAPAERYVSAEAFEQDLRRWLRHEPVLAHPSHWTYRTRKFMRRHALPVAAGAVATLSLAVGLGVALHQAEAARRQAQRTLAVQDFLIGLFNEADPAHAQGRELSAHDLLARGERELTRLAAEPDLAAQLGGVLMTLYGKLGDGVRALPLAEQQVAWALQQHGAGSMAHGDALMTLGRIHTMLDHHEQALATLAQADAVLAQHGEARADARLTLAMMKADNLQALLRTGEALTLAQDTLQQLLARHGAQHWTVIKAEVQVATQLAATGQLAKSREALQRLAPALARDWPEQGLEATELRADVGYALWQLREFEASGELLRQAIAELERLAGPRNAGTIQASRTLGMLYMDSGQYARAAEVLRSNVARSRTFYGPADSETALNLSFLVLPLYRTNDVAAALAAAREAWQLVSAGPGTLSGSEQRGVRRRFAGALLAAGQTSQALAEFAALADDERAAGGLDTRHATTLLLQAGALNTAGQPREALASAEAGAALFGRSDNSAGRLGRAKCLMVQTLALVALQRLDEAAQSLAEAERLFNAELPAAHPDRELLPWIRSTLLQAGGQTAAAETMRSQASARYTERSGGTLPERPSYVF